MPQTSMVGAMHASPKNRALKNPPHPRFNFPPPQKIANCLLNDATIKDET
jgi:hypothetical protein